MFASLPLDTRLIENLSQLGFSEATPVQEQAIPFAMDGKDLWVSAETGSGKSAAFLLPILQRLIANPVLQPSTRALILVPTRELATQLVEHFEQFAQGTDLKAMALFGGEDFKKQAGKLKYCPQVLIATPARLAEHLEAESCTLAQVEVLVLDEADRLLTLDQPERLIELAGQCREDHQTMLFSATLKSAMRKLVDQLLNEPEQLHLAGARTLHENIKSQVILADDDGHKARVIASLLRSERYRKAVIFANSKTAATDICNKIRYHKLRAVLLQGDLTPEQRKQAMKLLDSGKAHVLVATDIAARGLDIDGVHLVINYQVPRRGDDYVHRAGRAGRGGDDGLAVTLVKASEWNLMASVERYLKQKFERRVIEGLEANFTGPAKVKASGKAAGKKKKKKVEVKAKAAKKKVRQRDTKNLGKRRGAAKND